MYVHFDQMEDDSRIWIYQATRPFTLEEEELTSALLQNFTEDWAAHGTPLKSSFVILHHRFIVLCVDENQAAASGCSIDSSVGVIREIQKVTGIDMFDRLNIAFRADSGLVVSAKTSDFKAMIEAGDITPETIVFDNTVANLAELKTKWETAAKNTWVDRYFAKA